MAKKPDWHAALSEALGGATFEYVPGRGAIRDVEFRKSQGIDDVELTRWSLEMQSEEPVLKLWSVAGLTGHLRLDRRGYWTGRDRDNANIALRPLEAAVPEWQKLSRPGSFVRSVEADPRDGFHFREPLHKQIDWSPFAYDLSEKVHQGALPKSDTAVALVACDRPVYLKRTLDALVKNEMIHHLPVFAFMDHPLDAKQADVQRIQIEMVQEALPHAVVIARRRNFGCGRNIMDARRQLFDNMGYDRVWVFEDDLEVSPHYMGLVTRLFDWAELTYGNIGAVQGWSHCVWSLDRKQVNLGLIKGTYTNWWGYLMSRKCWEKIREEMYRFEELFLGSEYRLRPHRSIREWFRLKLKRGINEFGDHRFVINDVLQKERENYFKMPPTGQDAATMHLFEKHGFMRLATVVNRGLYIGKQGIHMNPTMFAEHGFESIVHNVFPEDAELSRFTLTPTPTVPIPDAIPGVPVVDSVG